MVLTDNLTLHVGGDWNEEAEIETFSQGQFNDINGNPIAILPGNRLANAPEFSFNAALDYGFTLGEWNSSARLDFYRVADFFNRATNELTTKGYYTFNARVALNSPDGSWRLSLFGRNLTDEVIRYETNEVGTFFGNARTFGVEATWSLQQ